MNPRRSALMDSARCGGVHPTLHVGSADWTWSWVVDEQERAKHSFDDQKMEPFAGDKERLEIAAHEVIRTLMSARINRGRRCMNQWAIEVKDPQGITLIEGHAGLNSSQRIFGHEKRGFHHAIMSPESYSPPRDVVSAATIWKAQGHGVNFKVTRRRILILLGRKQYRIGVIITTSKCGIGSTVARSKLGCSQMLVRGLKI